MARQVDIRYIDFCTDGNTARAFAPAPHKKVQLPQMRRKARRVVRIDPLALAGIVVAAVMMALMVTGVFHLRAVQQEQQQMAAYVDTLTDKNMELRAEFYEVCDMEQVQKLALALGMIPREEAPQTGITMYVPEETVEELTLWERIGIFLAGLFA